MGQSKLEIIIEAIDRASGVLRGIGGVLGGVGGAAIGFAKATATALATTAAAATAAATALAVVAVKNASDLSESLNKVNVVFGDSANEIIKWSETAAGSLGQSQQQALEAAGTFGNLFLAMGMGVPEATNMSKSLVELASDLASFNNIDPALALEKLRAGLVGEIEPLRSLGVNLTAATVEAKAMAMGLVELVVSQEDVAAAANKLEIAQMKLNKAYKDGDPIRIATAQEAVRKATESLAEAQRGHAGELTAAAKAQAAYALILEQTTTAQGDFARTSTGLANTQRRLKATFTDITSQIGMALLPAVEQMANRLYNFATSDQFQGWIASISSWIKNYLTPGLLSIADVITDRVLPAIMQFVQSSQFQSFIVNMGTYIGQLITKIGELAMWLRVNVPLAIAAVSNWWTNTLMPAIRQFATYWTTTLLPALQQIWSWLSTNLPPAIQAYKDAWATVQPIMQAVSDFTLGTLLPTLRDVWMFLKTNLGPVIQAVGNFITTYLKPAFEAFVGFQRTVTIPLLKEIYNWFKTYIPQGILAVKNAINSVVQAFKNIGTAIQGVINRITLFINKLKAIKLPGWLTPGSPTPFEIGLTGIINRMEMLARTTVPQLARSLSTLQSPALTAGPVAGIGAGLTSGLTALPGAGVGMAGGAGGLTVVYSPVFSAASMHEFETQLVPLIDRQLTLNQRRRV